MGEFLAGKLEGQMGICEAFIVCANDLHMRVVAKAMPIPGALYMTPFQAITGYSCKKLVVFQYCAEMCRDHKEELALQQALAHLRSRLRPGYTDQYYTI